MGYPRFQRARAFKYVTRTAGNLTISSAAWSDLTTAMDIALEAQVGDVIEYGVNGLWSNEAVTGGLDVATIVSSAAVNHFISGGNASNDGATGWLGAASAFVPISGSIMYTIQTGDISSGLTTLRPRGKCPSGTKTVLAVTADPLHVWAKNLGPMDPH